MTPSTPSKASQSPLAIDVMSGLKQDPKSLPSKYFYDAEGDRLFQEIMHMPEYYLTDAEYEIMDTHQKTILDTIGCDTFDLVELGAGDGYKTKVLLRYLVEKGIDVRYCPVDISKNVLLELENSLKADLPDLAFHCLQGDYFDMLGELTYRSETPKVILFMGANIGNMPKKEAEAFLTRIRATMSPRDYLIVGFDLKKDPEVILRAYDDPSGKTAAFNLNLLTRLNRELGANFELDAFRHWETYDPMTGATRSYLVSKRNQTVTFEALKWSVHFAAWEAINVELSQKYSIDHIHELAGTVGLTPIRHLHDKRKYFVDTIFKKKE